MDMSSMSTSSSRILYDVPCAVCRDHSSGKHYGVFACDGCAGFFKRSIRRDRRYSCKARKPGVCLMDKTHRNQCRACRLAKCLDAGMNKDAVQNERGPRNSTIRRQMALFLKDPALPQPEIALPAPTLNLTITKHNLVPSLALPLFHNPYSYSHLNLLNPAIPCLPRIPSPPRIPSLLSPKEPEALCEAAASLLFMNVEWAKNIPAFASLSLPDRLVLLEETWKDLFVIGSAQFIYPTDLNILYDGKDSRIPRNEIEIFQNTLSEIVKRRPDNNEYSCLRAVALFKTSFGDSNPDSNPVLNGPDTNKLQDFTAVATFHDHSRVILNEYSARTCPLEISRGNELLKLLPLIRLVSSFAIVELFFRATIGEIPIERIICDMYRNNKDKA